MSSSKGLFAKYLNRIFIETGACGGDGIRQALDEGFEIVYSIEIDPHWVVHCTQRYKHDKKVHVILGDSRKVLGVLLSIIDEPITFWLDAHVGSADPTVLKELEIIGEHPIKTHSILIDDMRLWKQHKHGFSVDSLKSELLKVNPNYRIQLEDGYKPNDVITARV
jgi:hypothetical protein